MLRKNFSECLCHVFWDGGSEAEVFAGQRMPEIKLERMQRLSLEAVIDRMVEIICREWMSDVSHMHPDLVGAACFQMDFQEGMVISDGKPLIMCDSGFSMFRIDLPLDHGIGNTSDRGRDCPGWRGDTADNCQIGAADLTVSHLRGKDRSAEGVFGKNQCTGGIAGTAG